MQLNTLTVSVLGLVLLLLQLPVNATPATIASTNLIPILPTIRPLCRLSAVCATRSPPVCGRSSDGMCRRFRNICELLEANGRGPAAIQRWTHTPRKDCRRVREMGAQHAYWCYQDCPSRAVACPRSPKGQEICVRSRNHQVCKVIANRCQLLNNNCFSRPRNNWRQTDRLRCAQMQSPEPPKDHESTTTRRPRS